MSSVYLRKNITMEAGDNAPLIVPSETIEQNINISDRIVLSNRECLESRASEMTRTVLRTAANCIAQTLTGASVCVTLWFAFKSTPISAFQLHVALSVVGYQLFMAHGILSMRNGSGWSELSVRHRRRLHWILQLVGSVTAIAGTSIMIREKTVHFNTVHAKLALSALVFTCASLINGLASLFAAEFRRFIPPKLSKISHVVFGNAAFALSSVCLAFGYYKNTFKKWASEEFAYVMIGVVATYTALIVIVPFLSVFRKLLHIWKVKVF